MPDIIIMDDPFDDDPERARRAYEYIVTLPLDHPLRIIADSVQVLSVKLNCFPPEVQDELHRD